MNWTLLNVYNKTSEKWVKNPFRVKPEVQIVDANSTFNFIAEFAPYEPDQYFFQLGQCHIHMLNGAMSKNKRIIAQEE